MTNETIKNPDALIGPRPWENFRPVFSHVEVVHHPPLQESHNPIVNRLLETGHEVHKTVSTFYMGFPTLDFKLDRHFKANVRGEFQMRLITREICKGIGMPSEKGLWNLTPPQIK